MRKRFVSSEEQSNSSNSGSSVGQSDRPPYFRDLSKAEFERRIAQVAISITHHFFLHLTESLPPKLQQPLQTLILSLIATKSDIEILECGAKVYFYQQQAKGGKVIVAYQSPDGEQGAISIVSHVIATYLADPDIASKIEKVLQDNGCNETEAKATRQKCCGVPMNTTIIDEKKYDPSFTGQDAIKIKEQYLHKLINYNDIYKLNWNSPLMQQFKGFRTSNTRQTDQPAYFSDIPRDEFNVIATQSAFAITQFFIKWFCHVIKEKDKNLDFNDAMIKMLKLWIIGRLAQRPDSTIIDYGVKLSIALLPKNERLIPQWICLIDTDFEKIHKSSQLLQRILTYNTNCSKKNAITVITILNATLEEWNTQIHPNFPHYETQEAEKLLREFLAKHRMNQLPPDAYMTLQRIRTALTNFPSAPLSTGTVHTTPLQRNSSAVTTTTTLATTTTTTEESITTTTATATVTTTTSNTNLSPAAIPMSYKQTWREKTEDTYSHCPRCPCIIL